MPSARQESCHLEQWGRVDEKATSHRCYKSRGSRFGPCYRAGTQSAEALQVRWCHLHIQAPGTWACWVQSGPPTGATVGGMVLLQRDGLFPARGKEKILGCRTRFQVRAPSRSELLLACQVQGIGWHCPLQNQGGLAAPVSFSKKEVR